MDYRERWELKDYLVSQRLERRILLFHAGLVLLLLGFLLNFWYLQGVNGEEYANLAENNRMRRIPLPPTRGVIFDRHDEVIAATRPSLDLVLRRENPRDLGGQLRRLAGVLRVPYEELVQQLQQMGSRPLFEALVLEEDVSLEALARIEARRERFPAVEVRETARRHYPEAGLVSHAVGYVGEVSEGQLTLDDRLLRGDIVGKSGVEREFDGRLRGSRGWKLVSVNSLGRRIGESRVGQLPDHGTDLELTLDLKLQRVLQEALGEEAGAGVFMDPWTGEILAIASAPAFDPNVFADGLSHDEWRAIIEDPRRPLHDRAIASFYAPGSTFKIVMAVAGLETGTVTPTDRVFCNGSTLIYNRRRLCWKRGGHGWVDMRPALAFSCNVYFYELGKKLGIDAIHKYGKSFGLGQLSGVNIPGEEPGILPSQDWKLRVQRERWYPGDTISVAIGQGLLAVTPIQMARAISAVATSGLLPHPHLTRQDAGSPARVAVAPETFRTVRLALEKAVREGTGRSATRGAFTAAGKTGTAQVYKHSAGIDSDELPKSERDHAWFVGYAPVDKPKVAFAVVVEHGGHGGSTAAPIARKVLEAFFEEREDEPKQKLDDTETRAAIYRQLENSLVPAASAR
jgi:penicillin-binding protein 2